MADCDGGIRGGGPLLVGMDGDMDGDMQSSNDCDEASDEVELIDVVVVFLPS